MRKILVSTTIAYLIMLASTVVADEQTAADDESAQDETSATAAEDEKYPEDGAIIEEVMVQGIRSSMRDNPDPFQYPIGSGRPDSLIASGSLVSLPSTSNPPSTGSCSPRS